MSLPDEDQIIVFSADTGNVKTGSDLGVVLPSFTTTERDAISTPKNGAVIFNSTDNELQSYHSGQWNGSAYGEMYQVNNAVVTTINTVNVFEDIVNFTVGELKETTFSSSTLTTGLITATYLVTYSACLDGISNKTYEVAVKVDGTVRDESHSCVTIATGGRDVSVSGSFILTIGDEEDIKLVIANVNDSTNVIIVDASLNITRIR